MRDNLIVAMPTCRCCFAAQFKMPRLKAKKMDRRSDLEGLGASGRLRLVQANCGRCMGRAGASSSALTTARCGRPEQVAPRCSHLYERYPFGRSRGPLKDSNQSRYNVYATCQEDNNLPRSRPLRHEGERRSAARASLGDPDAT